MEIRNIKTATEFDQLTEDWRTLNIGFGGIYDQLREFDACEINEDEFTANVKVVMVDGQAVAYLTADQDELWCIETKAGHQGNGYAKALVQAGQISMAWEVCSDAGAAFFEALGIDFEDCRN